MRLGLVLFGAGRAGTIHLNNVARNRRIDLLYVVEDDIAKAEKALESTGIATAKVVDSRCTEDVLSDSAVQFVIVATPTHTHEKIVRAALHAKKGVFCEKPIAKSIDAVVQIYDEAARVGKPLFCAFQRRFDPNFVDVRDRMRKGEIGKLHVIKTCSRDSPSPSIEYVRTSGGFFVDSSVHDIDLVCWIVGELPITIQAQAHAFRRDIADAGDVDTIAIVMKFPSGVIAQIDMSRYSSYGYDQRIEVHGDKGMIIAANAKRSTVTRFSPLGECSDVLLHSFPQRYQYAYENELDHFVDVMLGEKELISTKKDAVAVMKIAKICEESYQTSKVIKFQAEF